MFLRPPKFGAFAPAKDSEERQSQGSMEDIPFMSLLQQPVEKMEGTSSGGASTGQTSDVDSGDGTIEMDPANRSTASSNKSTASPKSCGSPTPGSQPSSMPDDYVMVELVRLCISFRIYANSVLCWKHSVKGKYINNFKGYIRKRGVLLLNSSQACP